MNAYELPFTHFKIAAPLLEQAWFDEGHIRMVLEGIQPGRLFVDDPQNPTAALLCHPYEFYVVGTPNEALRQFIHDAPAEVDIFHTLYGYCAVPEWEQAILGDARGCLTVIPRVHFHYTRSTAPDFTSYLPPGAMIQPIDRTIAQQIDDEVHYRLAYYWGGYEAFLKHSFGFCVLLADGSIGSFVFGNAISAQYVDFGLETNAPFRQQGLASAACSVMLAETLKRGKIPLWTTDGPNIPSANLARKLGFEEQRPFSQLTPPRDQPPALSQGKWRIEAVKADVAIWQQVT